MQPRSTEKRNIVHEVSLRLILTMACTAALTFGAFACGRAKPEKQPVGGGADAKHEDPAEASPEAARPAAAATPTNGWAIASSKNTEKDMQAAEAAVKASLEAKDLPRLKSGLMSSVRRSIPHPDSAQFRGEHMNADHTALCGEVDYEQWKDGVPGRSGYRRFVMTLEHGGSVDTDGAHQLYVDAAARIDCTPDLNN